MIRLSSEAETLLKEILDHEKDKQYWGTKFETFSAREVAIARGCFKELQDSNLIKVQWGDNGPYLIWIQKDGYSSYRILVPQISTFVHTDKCFQRVATYQKFSSYFQDGQLFPFDQLTESVSSDSCKLCCFVNRICYFDILHIWLSFLLHYATRISINIQT